VHTADHMIAVRRAMLEAALLSFFRQCREQGYDAITIHVDSPSDEAGETIEVDYIASGMPIGGESL